MPEAGEVEPIPVLLASHPALKLYPQSSNGMAVPGWCRPPRHLLPEAENHPARQADDVSRLRAEATAEVLAAQQTAAAAAEEELRCNRPGRR